MVNISGQCYLSCLWGCVPQTASSSAGRSARSGYLSDTTQYLIDRSAHMSLAMHFFHLQTPREVVAVDMPDVFGHRRLAQVQQALAVVAVVPLAPDVHLVMLTIFPSQPDEYRAM